MGPGCMTGHLSIRLGSQHRVINDNRAQIATLENSSGIEWGDSGSYRGIAVTRKNSIMDDVVTIMHTGKMDDVISE